MDRMKSRIRSFMFGRYGADDLSKGILGVTLVLLILGLVTPFRFLSYVALAGIIWSYFRMFSRNFNNRSAENAKYLKMTAGIRKKLRIWKKEFDGRKDYKFFKCPDCSQQVRVPKGKGHIRITCPKCGGQFERDT
ncbi:MAG: hypothetical protein Q4G47_04400 [Lachnospiraceae bacterium]|nr:hypothetical protein [Lachnospiraceae bacterium]